MEQMDADGEGRPGQTGAVARRFLRRQGRNVAVKRRGAKSAKAEGGDPQRDAQVEVFLREMKHPLKLGIEAVRELILGASPKISEGIKWNVPSFRTTEYFATFHVRSRDRVQLVFHRGAKVRNDLPKGMEIADPKGLMRWLGKDRCLVTMGTGKEIKENAAALRRIVSDWIRYV